MIEVWPEAQWREAEALHTKRTHEILGDRLHPVRGRPSDPVGDFLFTYYRFPPARIARWDPGSGVILSGAGAKQFLNRAGYLEIKEGVTASPKTLPESRHPGLLRTIALLEATAARPARFGCFGLHEWAMIYRSQEIRHRHVPLRVSPIELAAVVEARPLVCTHFDAYRFFTPEAASRNAWTLDREGQLDHEQSGCLHANMDLYKWAHKFSPWVGSDLVLDTFILARDAREIDMRASPYDLRAYGYKPIPIETEAGRSEYEQAQRAIASRAEPLRQRLLKALALLVRHPPSPNHHAPLGSHTMILISALSKPAPLSSKTFP